MPDIADTYATVLADLSNASVLEDQTLRDDLVDRITRKGLLKEVFTSYLHLENSRSTAATRPLTTSTRIPSSTTYQTMNCCTTRQSQQPQPLHRQHRTCSTSSRCSGYMQTASGTGGLSRSFLDTRKPSSHASSTPISSRSHTTWLITLEC